MLLSFLLGGEASAIVLFLLLPQLGSTFMLLNRHSSDAGRQP